MTQYPTCTYIKTNGTICESPAMKDNELCYYHGRDKMRVANFLQARAWKCDEYMNGFKQLQESVNPEFMESLEIPALDDAVSIQVALTNIVRAICSDHITDKKAGLALYAIQVAVSNLPNLQLAIAENAKVAMEDPKPIRPFWNAPGYEAHLAKRGMRMLKQADIKVTKADERDEREKMEKLLKRNM